MALSFVFALLCALYPTDHETNYQLPRGGHNEAAVVFVDKALRHVNTGTALVVPIVRRDVSGLAQLTVVTFVGILATHVPKRVFNELEIAGTRLGQRPLNPNSKHNVPSGHSSLASAAAFFMCRRYGLCWIWLIIIAFLTMWARVLLDAHTVSAVLSGFFVGLAIILCFVSPKK